MQVSFNDANSIGVEQLFDHEVTNMDIPNEMFYGMNTGDRVNLDVSSEEGDTVITFVVMYKHFITEDNGAVWGVVAQ